MPTKDILTGQTIPRPVAGQRHVEGHDSLSGSRDAEWYAAPPPEPKGYRPPPLNHFQVDALLERKGFYDVVDSVSPKCAAAWAEVLRRVEGARDALDRRDDLTAQEAQARRDAARSAQAAVAAGKQVKVDLPDFAAQREAAEISARAHYDAALAALHAYKAVFDEELAPSLDRVVAEIAPTRAELQAALPAVMKPGQRLANLLAVADVLKRRIDPDDLSHRAAPEFERLAKAGPAALGTLTAWATDDHELVSGSRFTAPTDVQPSRAVRAALWEYGTNSDAARLAQLEFDEGYKITSHSRAEFEHRFRRVD